MAVIQYYLNGRQYADFVNRAEVLGISEHQLAKLLALSSNATDADVMDMARKLQMDKRGSKRSVRPL